MEGKRFKVQCASPLKSPFISEIFGTYAHKCQKVQRRVDRKVQELQEQTPKVERQAKRVAAGKKPLGRNPKTDMAAHAADLHQMDSVARSLRYLSCELRRLLGIVVLKDQGIIGRRERQEELDALLDLFAELCECAPNGMKQQIKKLFHHVQFALPALVSFCQPLDAVQQKAIQPLGEAALPGWKLWAIHILLLHLKKQ